MSEKTILLKDARYLIRDSETIVKESSVAVQGKVILGVGKAEDLEKNHTIHEVIDLSGKVLMPGLINCHTLTAETL